MHSEIKLLGFWLNPKMLLVGYSPAITISGTLSGCFPGRKTWLTSHGEKKQDSSKKFLGEHPGQWEMS